MAHTTAYALPKIHQRSTGRNGSVANVVPESGVYLLSDDGSHGGDGSSTSVYPVHGVNTTWNDARYCAIDTVAR